MFFYKNIICQNYFLCIKNWKRYFYLPLKRHRSAKASAVYHQGASRDESKPQIQESGFNNTTWSFLDVFVFVFSSWLQISYFLVSVDILKFEMESAKLGVRSGKNNKNFCSQNLWGTTWRTAPSMTFAETSLLQPPKWKKIKQFTCKRYILIYRSMLEHVFIYFILFHMFFLQNSQGDVSF